MYLDYFGLEKNPFSISPDPAFLWFGPKHQEAFAALRYGILEEKGFLCLTGEVGTGKTVLIRNLINTIEVPAIIISVPDPDMKPFEFFRYVAKEIKLKGKFRSKADFLVQFQTHINDAFGSDTRVLMILDEAQRLNFPLLEQVRLLSNIVSTKKRQLNIFLVGQTELDDLLVDDRAKATRQRIVVRHKLEPLNFEEITAYIYHRLQVAGADKVIFMPDAIKAVTFHTNGVPRAINVICDQALQRGFKNNTTVIDAKIVNSCPAAKELPQAAVEEDKVESLIDDTLKGEDLDQDAAPVDASQTNEPSQLRQAIVALLTVATLLTGFGAYQHFFLGRGTSEHSVMREGVPKLLADAPVRPEQSAAKRRGESELAPDTSTVVGTERPEEVHREKELPEGGEKLKTVSAPDTETQSVPAQDKPAEVRQERPPVRPDGSEDDAGVKTDTESAPVIRAAADDQVADRAARSPKAVSRIILYFKFDSIELTNESANDFKRYLIGKPSGSKGSYRLTGYTDASGGYWYNMKLSQRRANAVRDLLIEAGIDHANIVADGMGWNDPQAGGGSKDDSRKSRRVEVVFTSSP